jgi:hypothetical protein
MKGGIAMSRTYKDSRKGSGYERRISVRAIRRNPPDLRKLSRALIQLAMEQAAAEAAAAAEADTTTGDHTEPPDKSGRERRYG